MGGSEGGSESGSMDGSMGGAEGGSQGEAGAGADLPTGGQQPGTQGAGGQAGGADDLDEVFEKSLGDFDGVMGQEREGMASTGAGSGGSAQQREAGDAKSVGDAQGRGGMGGAAGGTASIPGSEGMSGGEAGGVAGEDSAENSAEGGGGQKDKEGEFEGGDFDESERDGANVAKIPDDIPVDGSGDDQVAEQIREAAMAEKDPIIREALWDEYRKHMGMK